MVRLQTISHFRWQVNWSLGLIIIQSRICPRLWVDWVTTCLSCTYIASQKCLGSKGVIRAIIWHLDTAVVGDRLPWEWLLVWLQTMALGQSCGWWQTTMRMVPCLTTDNGTWTQQTTMRMVPCLTTDNGTWTSWQTTMRMVPCLTTDNGTWTQLWLVTDYHENGSLFDYRQWHLDTAMVGDRLPWEWFLVWLQTMALGHSCGWWQTTMRMVPCLITDNGTWTQLWLVTDYHENGSLFDYRQWHLDTAVVGDRLPWEWSLFDQTDTWTQLTDYHENGPCLTTDNGTWTQLWLVTDYHENGSLFDYRQWHLDTAVVGDRLPWEWFLVWLQTMALGHSCGWWQTTMRMAPCLTTDNGTWTQLWFVTDYHDNGSLFDYRQWHLDTAVVGDRLPWEWFLVWLQTMALGHSCGWWQTTMRMTDMRMVPWEWFLVIDYRQWHLDTAVVGDRLPWEWFLVWLQTMALGHSCGWWQTTMRMVPCLTTDNGTLFDYRQTTMRMAPCLITDNGTWTQLWLVTDYHENGSLFDYRQWHLDTAVVGDRLPW